MSEINRTTKSGRSPGAGLLLGAGVAAFLVFAAPLLSGSNHTCPVLRERDLERGPSAQAVPAFARKYNVDCTYCHTIWPRLNLTGYKFRRLGYRMPYEVAGAPPRKKPPVTGAPTPKPVTGAGLISEGEKIFSDQQCATCHVAGGNVIDPSKPIKGAAFLKKYPEDKQIAAIIRHGVVGTAMPAYGPDRLSDDRLTAVIAYIRSLTAQGQ